MRKLLIFLLCLYTSLVSRANNLSEQISQNSLSNGQYETALVLPWNFVEQSINPTSGSGLAMYQNPIGPLSLISQGIPVNISQSELYVSLHFKPLVVNQNETTWETDQLMLTVNVSGFQVQKDEVEVVNGATVTVHLTASCSPFTLVQSAAHTIMVWDFTTSGSQVNAQLKSISLDWPPNSWQINGLSCTGPAGFADLVQNDINQQLANASAITPIVQSSLQQLVETQISNWINEWTQPQIISSAANASIQLTGSSVVNNEGLLFSGILTVGNETQTAPLIPLNLPAAVLAMTSGFTNPTFIFSTASVQDLVSRQNLWPTYSSDLTNFSGFVSLQRSKFLQFFLWPDLLHYTRQSKYPFTSQIAAGASIKFGTGLTATAQVPIVTNINSHRSGQDWNYLQLKTNLNTGVNFSVSQGQMVLKFTNPQLKTNAQFGKSYVAQLSPLTCLDTSVMDKALESSSNFKQTSFQLPTIQLTGGETLEASTLTRPTSAFFFSQWR